MTILKMTDINILMLCVHGCYKLEELSFCFKLLILVTADCQEQSNISNLACQGLLNLGRHWYSHGNRVATKTVAKLGSRVVQQQYSTCSSGWQPSFTTVYFTISCNILGRVVHCTVLYWRSLFMLYYSVKH